MRLAILPVPEGVSQVERDEPTDRGAALFHEVLFLLERLVDLVIDPPISQGML